MQNHLVDCGFRAAIYALGSGAFNQLDNDTKEKITDAMDDLESIGDENDWSKQLLTCLKGKSDIKDCRLSDDIIKSNFQGVVEGTNKHHKFYDATEKLHQLISGQPAVLKLVNDQNHEVCPSDHLDFAIVSLDSDVMGDFDINGDDKSNADKAKDAAIIAHVKAAAGQPGGPPMK
jgi:hypothetical protein